MSNKSQKRLSVDRGHDLNQRRLKGQLVDVSFLVADRIFVAHRIVVSLFSPYLRALLISPSAANFVEGDSDVVTLKGVGDADCFELLLDYLYTGNIVLNHANVYGLIEACQYLQLDDGLALACAQFLADKVSSSHCHLDELLKIWNVAEQFHLADLKRAILLSLEHRLDHFLSDGMFKYLGYEEIREVLDHPSLCLRNEKALFDSVLHWCERNIDQEDAESVLMGVELVSGVKLSVLQPQYVNQSLSLVAPGYDKSEAFRKAMKSKTTHVRTCDKCVFVFQYARDGSDILGIEEFVNQRKNEPTYAVFQPDQPSERCLSLLPSLMQSKSYFQHYGPHSTSLTHLLATEDSLIAIGGIKMSMRERVLTEEMRYFDFESGAWQYPGNHLPMELIEFGVAYHPPNLYVLGGLTDHYCKSLVKVRTDYMSNALQISTQVYRVNPRAPKGTLWTPLAEMPVARAHFSVERVGDVIFVVGEKFCDCYDSNKDAWVTLDNVPAGFGKKPGLASVGTGLFVFGNRPSQGNNLCYRLEVTSLTWREVPNPSLRQDVISAFTHNNQIYLIGWQQSWKNMIHRYDPVKESWTEVAKYIKGTIRPGILLRRQMLNGSFFFGTTSIETNTRPWFP